MQIINSFIVAARNDKGFLSVILQANILGLLRPFLQQELQGTARHMSQHSGDKLLVYDAADFELLAIIRKNGLRGLSPSNPSSFDRRQIILSRAFDVVLRRENNISEADVIDNMSLHLTVDYSVD